MLLIHHCIITDGSSNNHLTKQPPLQRCHSSQSIHLLEGFVCIVFLKAVAVVSFKILNMSVEVFFATSSSEYG